MKKKANIYDADDVERSKRLNFTPEERAARAEHKAEVLGTKLEKAKKKVPKKKKLRLQKELDPEKSKLKHTLRFEEVEKKRGQEALPKKAGRRMVQSASATVHSKIHQVEEENVGTKAAHRTELASEGAAALASHEIRKYRQNAPYKRVEKLEAQVNRANVVPLIVPLSGITRNCRKTPSSVLFRNSASSTSMPKSFGKQSRLRNRVQLLFRKQRICLAASVRPWRLRCRSIKAGW